MTLFLLGLAFVFYSVSATAQQAATLSYNTTDNVIEASMDATNTLPFGQFKTDGTCTTAGQMDYDSVNNRFEFCNGKNWVIADCEVPTGAGACAAAGEMRFNSTKNVYEFCNGTEYRYLMCPVSWVSGFTSANTATDGKLSISSDATQHWRTLDISDLIGTALVTSVAYGNDVWVGRTSDNDIIYSADGLTWAKTTDTDITGTVQNITFSNGRFITRATNNVVSSTDGINWSVVSALSYGTNFIDLGNSTWIGFHGPEVYQSTDDGVNWTKTLDRGGTSQDMLPQPIYVNGTLYGIDRDNDYSNYSFNQGATWVINTTVLSNNLAIGAHGRIYIWNGNVKYAEDGSIATWTSGASITSNSGYGKMGIGNGVAVATNYYGNRYISTDENLTSWTQVGTAPRREAVFAYGGSHNDPGNFTFTDQTGVAVSTVITSNSITIDSGVTSLLKVYVGNSGEAEKNGSASWIAGDGTLTVTGGDTLKVRMTSSGSTNTEKISTIQVGTNTTHWSVTTTP